MCVCLLQFFFSFHLPSHCHSVIVTVIAGHSSNINSISIVFHFLLSIAQKYTSHIIGYSLSVYYCLLLHFFFLIRTYFIFFRTDRRRRGGGQKKAFVEKSASSAQGERGNVWARVGICMYNNRCKRRFLSLADDDNNNNNVVVDDGWMGST